MRNARKPTVVYSIAVIIILSLLCISMAGCGRDELPKLQNETADNVDNDYDIDDPIDSDEANWDKEWYFYDEDGREAVHIISEGIVAYYDIYNSAYPKSGISRFDNLVPLFEEFPPPIDRERKVTYYPLDYIVDEDWSDYQHRLSQVKYNLKVHYSLESEIDRILKRILTIDGVVLNDDEMLYCFPVRWSSPEIFDEFVRENVNIEIIGKAQSEIDDWSDLTSRLTWQVYSGSCFPGSGPEYEGNVCKRHLFNIWLVDFTDTEHIIWDMKYVEEPGCGRLMPW